MIDRILYLLSEGIRGLLRTKITAIATIITIGITSSFVMISAQFGENLSQFVDIVRNQYELQIFFKENVDETKALNIISNIKYPPIGSRGVALGIAHDNYYRGGIPVSTQLELSNQKTTFFALIETKEGADNANEIASLTDVDCLWVGHFDLSASLGIPGQFDHHVYKLVFG